MHENPIDVYRVAEHAKRFGDILLASPSVQFFLVVCICCKDIPSEVSF